MKHEWRKHEKELYVPKNKPALIVIPKLKYFTIIGNGNPNGEAFSSAVAALYAMSYGIKMAPKKGIIPKGYFEYAIYPLEGIWTLNEKGIQDQIDNGIFDKEDLIFKIMIRQPDFVTKEFALETIQRIANSKSDLSIDKIKYEEIEEGLCLQMLHIGSYENEPLSFQILNQYCQEHKLERASPNHKEIYLTDARRSSPESNKTVLRILVQKNNEMKHKSVYDVLL